MAIAVEQGAARGPLHGLAGEYLPKLVVAPSFVITLFFVYGFIAWTTYLSFTKSRMMPVTAFDGIRPYERLWANPVWWTALENLAIFGVLYIGIATVLGLAAGDPARPEDPRPRASSAPSTSTRWRSPSSSPARPGSGCSTPASASRSSMHDWGFDQLHVRLDHHSPTWRSTARHRRRLADVGLRHGDVPGGPARRRQRDHQGGADRRRHDLPDLLADHHPADAPGVPLRLRHPRPPRDQELRPDGGADRRRPRLRHRAARDLHVPDDLHPQRGGARRRAAPS